MRQITRRHQPTRPRSFRHCLSWLLALTLIAQTAALPTTRAAHPKTTAPAATPEATTAATPPATQSNVDLTVTALSDASVVTDSQTLLISGELVATIKNLGSAATAAQFRVLTFEDRNANGQFNAGTDALLGSINVTDSIAAGASANLSLALSGVVTFKGNLIYVLVDSENAIAEADEANNVRHTGQRGEQPSTGQNPAAISIAGTVRDFKAANEAGGHPDFECCIASEPGLVNANLGGDKKPVYAGGQGTRTTHGRERFDQWYRDTPGVNINIPYSITLERSAQNQSIYTYSNGAFFPIDNQGFGNFGSHNFHFTFEIHSRFIYQTGQVFNFTGDDDVWVFINNKLVIDLGGVHAPQNASVNLDQLANAIGLVPGNAYDFDFFFAERHTGGSNLFITTSIVLDPSLPDLMPSVIRKNDTAFPTSTELTARIGNGGSAFVPPGVRVSFYRGDPAAGGTLIGTTQTVTSLQPGQHEDVKVVWNNPPTGLHPITVVADDNGSGQGTVTEGNETNNKAMANIALGIGPFTLVDDLIARFKDSAVGLQWSPIVGAVGYNVYRRTGNGAPQLIAQNHPRANFADSGLTNRTTYYYTVRWVNGSNIESADGTEMSATPTAQANRHDVPPTILSAPVTRAVANAPYSYDALARDPNAADALVYSLPTPQPEALRGLMVNAASGLLQWTPGFTSAGYQNVTVRVQDSRGRFATQTYRLFVEIPNSPPLANAGPDQTIMATETATLLGTALDDGLPFGGTLTTSWTKVSGPGAVTFANPSQAQTTATFSAQGSYVLRLTANDSALASSDDITINVVRPFASRLYTLNADFNEGILSSVSFNVPHQLQINDDNTNAVIIPPLTPEDGDWTAKQIVLFNTPEADLMVRIGDIDNLNFGFPIGFTPFSGNDTPSHSYPWQIDPSDPPGTDRIMVVSSYNGAPPRGQDGYTSSTSRPANNVQPLSINFNTGGVQVRSAVLQMFVDDFQSPVWGTQFQATLNGVRAPFLEDILNSLNQTGPIGKFISLSIPAEFLPLLASGQLQINIDDLTTGAGDGFAIDFVRLLINPKTLTQRGTWTVAFDSKIANAEWGRIRWNAQTCGDGGLFVTAASSADNITFSAPQNVTRGQDLTVPNGRYLMISVLFRRASTGESPILYDLAVGTDGYAPPAQVNAPPTVNAGVDLTTALLIPVPLQGAACDDGLPDGTLSFTWSKVSGPGTITFANANALATTATINTPGNYVLRLTVSDAQTTVSDDLTITIEGTNRPPVIASQPPTAGCSTRPYAYQVVANDPNFGDVLSYTLPTAPAGMTISATTGLIQWTPTAAQLGNHNVTVRVTDLGNNTIEQSWTINIASGANTAAPTITSTAPTATAVGLPYTYQIAATDPDSCEVLTYSLDVAPAGMTINAATGLLAWTPSAAQTGNHNVTVRVRDFAGLFATQSFTINVGPTDNTPPVVAIASPAADATLSADVPVVGSISDANLQSWTLEYKVSGGQTWVTLATGTTPINNATLATFPATLLANNAYILRLRASDPLNQNETFREVIVNSGDLKLGAFTLAYEDLRLPFAGVPIVLRRFYDSRRAESGDFGPGWTLGFSNVDMRTDANLNVFITLPNGRRVAFAFAPGRVGFFPVYANRYVAPPGVYDSLENTDSPFLFNSSGQWFDLDFSPYTPQNYILKTKEGLTFTLSATDGIRKIEDRNNRFIEITPNGVTSSIGRNVIFTRNAAGRITQITDPANNTLKYDYDAQGRLVKFTDQLNLATNYTYYGSGHYIQDVLTPGGCRPLKTEYGPDGRVSAKVDSAGNRSTFSYDQANRTETVTNALTQTTVYKYDARGNLLEVRAPLNRVTTYAYDASNNLTSVTLPTGRTTTRSYDGRGNVITHTESPQAGTLLTTSYTYNAFNQLVMATRPLGDKTVFYYDDQGNLIRREYRTAADAVVTEDSFTYDARGNQQTWTDGAGKVTEFTYNSRDELISRRDPTGVTTRFEYDANSNTSAVIDGLNNRAEFDYNGFNLLTRVRHGGQTIAETTYNELNQPLTTKDALGRTTTLSYDCQGNLLQITDAAGRVTRYQVDALTNLKRVTDANQHETQYLYDPANRQTGRTGPDGQTFGVAYTPDDLAQSITSPDRATTQFAYDGMGRLTRETRPDKTVEFTYADCCRQSQVAERIGNVTRRTSYAYDELGRLQSVTDPQNRSLSYTYNRRGQRASLTTPGGGATNYVYNDAGRLAEVQVGSHWVRFTYDAAGRRTQLQYSNGASSAYSYNVRGQLTGVTIRGAGGTVIASYAYTLDGNGNRTGTTYHDGTASYTLDNLQRLTNETVNATSLGSYNRTYAYDAVGNRQDAGASFGPDDRLLGDAGGTYGYDLNGNIISRGTKMFAYDSQHRLVGFTNVGIAASYQYDYLGRRTSKTVNGLTREFLYDGDQIVAEYVGGAQVARYAYGLTVDEPLLVQRGGQTYFYHADGLGSVVALTDSAGQTAQRYGYDAWGNLRLNNGSFAFNGTGLVNTLTFTGREYDEESGLYHYRARAYDPAIGRFIQKDPQLGRLALPQSQHRYAYALNNPANLTDPSGEAVIVSFALQLNSSSINEAAAALIGLIYGYALPSLAFIGSFLGQPPGLSLEEQWDGAIGDAEELLKFKDPTEVVGLPEELENACLSPSVSLPVDLGLPGAFLFGSGLEGKLNISVSFTSTTLTYSYQAVAVSTPYAAFFAEEIAVSLVQTSTSLSGTFNVGISLGGFNCGRELGLPDRFNLKPR